MNLLLHLCRKSGSFTQWHCPSVCMFLWSFVHLLLEMRTCRALAGLVQQCLRQWSAVGQSDNARHTDSGEGLLHRPVRLH